MFLEIKGIEKYYGTGDNRTKVLKGITTGVEKGKICVLLGPSGSGKSTLLNIIGGIEKQTAEVLPLTAAELKIWAKNSFHFTAETTSDMYFNSTILFRI